MQALPINLDIQCEICDSNEYSEHESGFYVCVVCGTMTPIRFGMGLDYADIHKSSMVIRRKATIDEMDDGITNNDTMGNTMVNTCANSELGDSNATRLSKGKGNGQVMKTFNEVLMEHQKIFVNLFKAVCYFQYLKYDKCSKGKENNSQEHSHSQEEIQFGDFIKFFEKNEHYQKMYNTAKTKWKDLVAKEYSVQKIRPINVINKNSRSRMNTEDKNEKHFTGVTHGDHAPSDRRKRNSIREQLKTRKVKNFNIENIPDIKDKKMNKNAKMNLFIEEYDQVKIHLESYEEVIQREIGVTLTDAFAFKNILLVASKIFNINLQQNSSYEEVIHQIFIHSGLNLISVFKEGDFFDESKTHLTPDSFLSIFHSIINSNITNIIPPLYNGELISIFKSMHMSNLYNHEIKFLKYLNKEKLLKLLDHSGNKNRIVKTIKNLTEDILKLPSFFTKLTYSVFLLCETQIEAQKNYINNLESFLIGIILYLIKMLYGLNELPYVYNIFAANQDKQENLNNYSNKLESESDIESDIDCKKIIKTFIEKANKDKLFSSYKQLPGLLGFIKVMKDKIKEDEGDKILWEENDHNRNHNINYKEKFLKYTSTYLASIENNCTKNNINSLEKKINLTYPNFQEKKKVKVCVKFSEKLMKIKETNMKEQMEERELNAFIKEELEFYEKLNKKKKGVDVPFPCDTFLKFNKQAMKFENVKPALQELIVYFYFSKLFRIDYKILKKCTKIIEKATEEKIKL